MEELLMRSVPRDFMESLRRRTCHFDLIYNSQNLQGFDVSPRDSFVSSGSQRDESVSPKPFALRTLREQSPAGRWNEEMRCHLNAPWWDKRRGCEVDFCRERAATSPPSNILRFAKKIGSKGTFGHTKYVPPKKMVWYVWCVFSLKGIFCSNENWCVDVSLFTSELFFNPKAWSGGEKKPRFSDWYLSLGYLKSFHNRDLRTF